MQAIHDGVESCGGESQYQAQFPTLCQNPFPGELFKKFSPAALKDLSSLAASSSYPANYALYSEKEELHGIYIVLEGEVKLSINSSEGRRLSLRIAQRRHSWAGFGAVGKHVRNDGRDGVPIQASSDRQAGVSWLHDPSSRGLPSVQRRADARIHNGLRAIADSGVVVIRAGEAGAPAAGLEREWADPGARGEVPVLDDARGDWRVHWGIARDGDENA
jgi:hypothetical protein